MTHYVISPPDTTLYKTIAKADQLTHILKRGTHRLHLTPIREVRLNALLGLEGRVGTMTMADVNVRKASSAILYSIVDQHIADLIPDGTPTFHITFVDDLGLTTDRKPKINLTAFRRKVDKAIRALGLSGIVIMEIQALTNYPAKGRGRTLMLNAHALCWGEVSRRHFRAAMNKLNKSRSWTNSFGAKPVYSRQLKNGIDDALRITCYQTKAPFGAKYRAPHPKQPGSFRFRSTLSGFTDTLALRIMEGLSQISIYDSVFCVGDAKHIRKLWKTELMEWHKLQLAMGKPAIKGFDVARLWKRIRRANRQDHYRPYIIQ